MRAFLCLPFISVVLAAQTTGGTDLLQLTRELRVAVGRDSLASVAGLAAKLDDAVQQRYQAWLVRDRDQRVNEVLTWLPPAIEVLWVNQRPFTIQPEEPAARLEGWPIQAYSTDRLMALDGGSVYRALANHTVRLVVSAAENFKDNGHVAIPSLLGSQDVVYFYFFADSIDLPSPNDSLQGRPVWRLTANVLADGPRQPGVEPAQRADENWIILARPDLLVLSNRPEMLTQILARMAGESKSRALPDNLPEWAHVNRTSSFWGLRHYSAASKPALGQPGYDAAELPRPDGAAAGVALQFDQTARRLQIDYISPGRLSESPFYANDLKREFHIDRPEPGVWRLISDVQARGDYPVHFAMTMLGFGSYR